VRKSGHAFAKSLKDKQKRRVKTVRSYKGDTSNGELDQALSARGNPLRQTRGQSTSHSFSLRPYAYRCALMIPRPNGKLRDRAG
jgi:hypothetical protein